MTEIGETTAAPANKHLLQILLSGKYSDLTLRCAGREYKVHKTVVCGQSSIISAACDLSSQGGNPRGVDIHTARGTLERMLLYIYNEDYDDQASAIPIPSTAVVQSHQKDLDDLSEIMDGENQDQKPNQHIVCSTNGLTSTPDVNTALINNVQVCITADYYKIDGLKQLAMEKFKVAAKQWQQPRFFAVVEAVYNEMRESDDILRRHVSDIAANHAGLLAQDAEFLEHISHIPEFTKNFIQSLSSQSATHDSSMSAENNQLTLKSENLAEELMVSQGKAKALQARLVEMKELNKKMSLERDEAVKKEESTCNAVQRMMILLNTQEDCRHCDDEFIPYCDNPCGPPSVMVLRCSSCTTRHYH